MRGAGVVTGREQALERIHAHNLAHADISKVAAEDDDRGPQADEVDRFIAKARQHVVNSLMLDARSKIEGASTPLVAAVHHTRLERLKYTPLANLEDDPEVKSALNDELCRALEEHDPHVREMAYAALERLATTVDDLVKAAQADATAPARRAARAGQALAELGARLDEAMRRWPGQVAPPDVMSKPAPAVPAARERERLRYLADAPGVSAEVRFSARRRLTELERRITR